MRCDAGRRGNVSFHFISVLPMNKFVLRCHVFFSSSYIYFSSLMSLIILFVYRLVCGCESDMTDDGRPYASRQTACKVISGWNFTQ